MRVRYTPRAFATARKFSRIWSSRVRRRRATSRDIKSFIAARIASLGDSPRRSRLIKGLSVHAHWLGRYPYIIYYRVAVDEVHILHIRHAARRPWQGE